jgi:uncharacterized protein involved in cysteine biosynthesis
MTRVMPTANLVRLILALVPIVGTVIVVVAGWASGGCAFLMAVKRIKPNIRCERFDESRAFSCDVIGLREGEGWTGSASSGVTGARCS